MSDQPHFIRSDERMNKALKNEIGGLRGSMLNAAEAIMIPERFYVYPDPDSPSMWIGDSETGEETNVSLYAYREVRVALSRLAQEDGIDIVESTPLFARSNVRDVFEALDLMEE